MHIEQKVRFVGNKHTGIDNIFLNDDRLRGKILTITFIYPNGEISLQETEHGFARNRWLSSIFTPAIILPNNIKVL